MENQNSRQKIWGFYQMQLWDLLVSFCSPQWSGIFGWLCLACCGGIPRNPGTELFQKHLSKTFAHKNFSPEPEALNSISLCEGLGEWSLPPFSKALWNPQLRNTRKLLLLLLMVTKPGPSPCGMLWRWWDAKKLDCPNPPAPPRAGTQPIPAQGLDTVVEQAEMEEDVQF